MMDQDVLQRLANIDDTTLSLFNLSTKNAAESDNFQKVIYIKACLQFLVQSKILPELGKKLRGLLRERVKEGSDIF